MLKKIFDKLNTAKDTNLNNQDRFLLHKKNLENKKMLKSCYADFYKKDVTINVLGPVGDKVEEWSGKGAFITDADFGEMSWDEDGTPATITMTIRCDYWVLQY